MRVEFIHSLISNVSPHRAGDVADLDEATAIKYIQRGLCKPAPDTLNIKGENAAKMVETMQQKRQAETAMESHRVTTPKPRGRRKRNA